MVKTKFMLRDVVDGAIFEIDVKEVPSTWSVVCQKDNSMTEYKSFTANNIQEAVKQYNTILDEMQEEGKLKYPFWVDLISTYELHTESNELIQNRIEVLAGC
ncbi:hypothetical protein LP037_050 [Listeria phage LP-037]|uniref:Uncharacterized protein n=2 Tax=Homburgvirus TaxID=1921125 RepID=S4U6H5_9CAUD|nr:hypothetical protein P70_0076 [Listeria phage P70]YP_008240528.1 hypothetical protein LP037_050 [Listeria phage LP-037]AFQ96265.1 hypothetical protein P70_0076 [Listeria phage P70]AGI11665.1 hypothetical protein LP037_050 [Listeria phage LP-037]